MSLAERIVSRNTISESNGKSQLLAVVLKVKNSHVSAIGAGLHSVLIKTLGG
ncbi:MAG: hypothetical protein ACYS6K_16770 [Planctomycetota bacterium]